MKLNKIFLYTVLAFGTLAMACKSKESELVQVEKIKVTYVESNEDFPNPERGFYRYSETYASNFTVLDANELKGYRSLQSISNANYKVYSTLVFRYYILDGLTNAAIGASFLTHVQSDFDAARTAGVKLIPRFVYTVNQTAGNCPEGFICPPYGDAPKNIILNHISQLKPVLQSNADVIAAVQLGFIGTWGEQYYSDYFGDASSNGNQDEKLLDQNWMDRNEVLQAMLDAVPKSRMVQVRYPQLKQRFLYGKDAPITVAPMAEQSAFNESDIARIGFHNDCFLASSSDYGTYEDYGNSSTPRTSNMGVVNTLRDYVKQDGKYVVAGGETCSNDYSPANDCEPVGKAQEEFALMHYSYLNAHYNNEVNNDWQTGGCMDNIKRNLGYRFVLKDAVIPDNVVRGTALNFTLNMINKGYASPYNKRPAKLILRNQLTGDMKVLDMVSDVRKWFSGNLKVEESIKITSDIPAGKYELLLFLPDGSESISNRPEYAIRLANQDVWEPTTGYNKLNHVITIH